ncbi:MAG: 4-hydroxythreonine-4-phosphate dehydrogenase PdxA [Thermodesulfobacteriales bacterium]|jgi:4-hydroxythreonine-4-phosphate dehydrogenase|nr:MAG: 4-hydroxythreonine-4-phosphate dehydrogenase PdxA [Thermodesulfobacteriales bacterium]
MSKKPIIGITMGDPNGVGPEVIVKAISSNEIKDLCEIVIFGDAGILQKAANNSVSNIKIVECSEFGLEDLKPSTLDRKAGQASLDYITTAVKSALENEIDAIVTAPISKESTHLAGSKYPGHTEMLKDLSGSNQAVMMFEGQKFKVMLVTIHEALSNVPKLISKDRVLSTIKLTHDSLVTLFKIDAPKIVVCGLNPHAGESGAFGNEEIDHIIPAVEEALELGINIEGPLPADTLFYYANQGKWDAVVAMYHDQGLIPFKMVSFNDGVNITLGLPIIRTSPDHGTAFDIAWKGVADPSSMIAAIKVAAQFAINKST